MLARVAAQGLELAVERVGDVDEHVGGARGGEVHLAGRPGLEPLVEQLRVRERVAGVGVDRRHRGLTGSEVVGMARVDALEVALRRLREHALRTHPPDLSADVAAQVEARLEPAVGVAQERDVGDADHLGRRPLLRLADLDHRGARHGEVEAAGFAAGADAVRHLDARVGPARDGSRAAEVDVIGVRGDDQDAFHTFVAAFIALGHHPNLPVARQLRAGPSPSG
jgi:hypothetical protein